MSIPKVSISWPLDGGLDTIRSPLTIQPGSFLQLDNVTQPRKGEWRRRNGMTQAAADTSTSYGPAPYVSNLGPSGVLAYGAAGGGVYRPSLTSNKWAAVTGDYPSAISRVPVAEANGTTIGFAACGDVWLVSSVDATTVQTTIMDAAGRASIVSSGANQFNLRVRCAATATHLVAFQVQSAAGVGSLFATVVDAATGLSTTYSMKTTGIHATEPFLDAHWYGGSTITVVARSSTTDNTLFMEFNPSTGVLSTDITLSSNSQRSNYCLSLLPDPGASGVRFVAMSGNWSTPRTAVMRINSAGTVLTNETAEAVLSTQIAGIANTAGADWSIVYRTTTPALKATYKTGGVISTNTPLRATNTADLTIDSMAWGEEGGSYFQLILGCHSTNVDDAQDSWVIASFPRASGIAFFKKHSPIVPQQGAAALSLSASLYQVVRTAARTYKFCLPVLSHYTNEAGTVTRQYSCDVFTQTWLTEAELGGTLNIGRPVPYKDTAFIPTSGMTFFNGGKLSTLGTAAPPRAPTLTQGAGGSLTLLQEYQYLVVVERRDVDGNVWRSPPSVPTLVTLTGANNKVTVDIANWNVEDTDAYFTVVLYRTEGGGSLFRRIWSTYTLFNTAVQFVDTLADTAISTTGSQILYTPGELATMITPRLSHTATFGDRLWGINADFPTELWPSKNLRPGRLPEFAEEGVLDIDDGFGDLTNVIGMDDKGIVFKRNAVYFVQGDGFSDAGTGEIHTVVQVSSDVGSLLGTPVISTGDRVYFVAERGIFSIDRAANVEFIGAPVDQYLHQPEVQTAETVFDACFVPAANEVRFLTTNYLLVYNRTFGYWCRWTGLAGYKRCLVVNSTMYLFKTDGTVWKEGTSSKTTDQGVAFTGEIRSPWMRPDFGPGGAFKATTGQQGLRLYKARIVYTRTAGGSSAVPIGKIYRNNDNAKVETFTSGAVAGSVLSSTGEMAPINQKCTSFSVALVLPSGDTTIRVDGFTALVAPRGGDLAVPAASKWATP